MFSKPYKGVMYFGHWSEATADSFGGRDALAVLRDAVERCADEDMRTPEVRAALAFLLGIASRREAFARFWQSLHIQDPIARSAAVLEAYGAIARVLGLMAPL